MKINNDMTVTIPMCAYESQIRFALSQAIELEQNYAYDKELGRTTSEDDAAYPHLVASINHCYELLASMEQAKSDAAMDAGIPMGTVLQFTQK